MLDESTSKLEQIYRRSGIGGAVHTIMEWTGFCMALFTVCLSLAHFKMTRDPTMPIVCTALFLSGMIDAFRILTADGLIATVYDQADFIPFTWMISRTFNVVFLIAGCAPFIFGRPALRHRNEQHGIRFIFLVGLLFALMAYAIIHVCAVAPTLPATVFSGRLFSRPWDGIPLVLYMLGGGIVFPRFYRLRPSLFSHALLLSVVPNLMAQAHVALGSEQLFDNDFNIALFLKVVAYAVPLAGLVLDYARAYGNEVQKRVLQQKLDVVHDVQQGLLPRQAPSIRGFDISGDLHAVDGAGGDYFDYILLQDNTLLVVVADVSGHDIAAAMLMAVTRAYLRAAAAMQLGIGEIATRVNRFLSQDMQSRWLVTLFLARLDPVGKTLDYAAAGHECYLVRTDGTVVTMQRTSPPIGVLDEVAIDCGPQQKMQAGDVALLLTDGLAEATSTTGEQFGLARIKQVVIKSRDRSAAEIVQSLRNAMTQHCGGSSPHDDVTVVVVKSTE